MSGQFSRFSLRKRSHQVYHITYYLDGKRHSKSTGVKTKPEALAALTKFKELIQTRALSISVRQFISEFTAYGEANYARKTMKLYKAIMEHFATIVRDIPMHELTSKHIDRYKTVRLSACKGDGREDKEKKEKISPISVNVELRMLKSALNTARRWKLIDSNPFEGVALAEVPERDPIFFTRADFQTLLQSIKHKWLKEVVVFAVLTGMRRGELLNLRWAQIDWQRRMIQIQSTPTFRTKQGKKRTIPLSETAMYLLQAKYGKDASEHVFLLNGKPIFDGWLTHAFKKAVTDAKLEKGGLHFHSLRHTFASWLVQDGVSLYEVQKLLGHSSSKVTEIYSHLQPEQMHSTVNRIDLKVN
jgi:integrase